MVCIINDSDKRESLPISVVIVIWWNSCIFGNGLMVLNSSKQLLASEELYWVLSLLLLTTPSFWSHVLLHFNKSHYCFLDMQLQWNLLRQSPVSWWTSLPTFLILSLMKKTVTLSGIFETSWIDSEHKWECLKSCKPTGNDVGDHGSPWYVWNHQKLIVESVNGFWNVENHQILIIEIVRVTDVLEIIRN